MDHCEGGWVALWGGIVVPDVHFLCQPWSPSRTLSYHWTVNVALCGEKSTSVLSQVWANNLAFLQSALDTGVVPIRGASRRCRIFCGGDSPWLRRLSGGVTLYHVFCTF